MGLTVLCPLTTQVKGYPFEVVLPHGLKAQGAVLADQVKSLDWHARNAEFLCRLPVGVVEEVLGKTRSLLA